MANDPRFEVFPQRDEGRLHDPGSADIQWRWHFRAENGRLVAASGEGFDSLQNATRSIHDFLRVLRWEICEDGFTATDPQIALMDAAGKFERFID